MTGRSYGGTTDFAVASTGVKGLKTIVPVAGIASWYEYTNSQGIATDDVAYSDNLAFYCAGRYINTGLYQNDTEWKPIKDIYPAYLNRIYNDQIALNGDYGPHWATRDYTAGNDGKAGTASTSTYNNFNCPALIVHGLNDDNVRTKQFQLMYDAFKNAKQNVKLLLHQGEHITPDYDDHKTSLMIGNKTYSSILNEWYSHYLYGQNTNDGATKTMEDLLNAYPDQIDIVLCHNDDTAIGAMNACKSAGVDDMIIVGFDGNASAVDLILAGEMVKATVAQQPYEMGYQAVEAALKAINGETVEEVINAPVTVVTAENGQEYLDSLAAMQG